MKKSSRNWTIEEDKMLEQVMQTNATHKLKWEEVAEIMHEKIINCQKTGKQCRQRWHNHLAPQLNNSGEWTAEQNQILFKHHAKWGNKWAKIATHLKGRTDNCVKNHFYSTLRRGMRKVNNFIHQNRKKKNSLKQFKPDVLTKILIVADGDPQQKLNAKNNAQQLSRNIKDLLIEVSLGGDQDTYDEVVLNKVIELIMDFNKNCKKRKGKKKGPTTEKVSYTNKDESAEQEDDLSEDEEDMTAKAQSAQIKEDKIEKITKPAILDREQREKEKQNYKEKVVKKEQKQKQEEQQKQKSFFKLGSPKQSPFLRPIFGKDEVKFIEQIPHQVIIEKQQVGKYLGKGITRIGSMESYTSEVPNNFTACFSVGNFANNGESEIEKLFKSSGFGLAYPTENQTVPSARQIFGDSGLGIRRNEALLHLSTLSGGDERNSIFNLSSERGVIEAEDLMNGQGFKLKNSSHSSGVFSNSFANIGNTFGKTEPSGSMFKSYIPDDNEKLQGFERR